MPIGYKGGSSDKLAPTVSTGGNYIPTPPEYTVMGGLPIYATYEEEPPPAPSYDDGYGYGGGERGYDGDYPYMENQEVSVPEMRHMRTRTDTSGYAPRGYYDPFAYAGVADPRVSGAGMGRSGGGGYGFYDPRNR